MGTSGKTAPSFIVTMVVVALLVAAYLAFGIWSPNDIARSERAVRDFTRAAAAEIGPLRRALREQTQRYEANPDSLEEVRAAIDDLADDAKANVEEVADATREEIEMMDGIGLRTQENRLGRVQQRKADAESRISSLVNEARSKLPAEGARRP